MTNHSVINQTAGTRVNRRENARSKCKPGVDDIVTVREDVPQRESNAIDLPGFPTFLR